MSAQRPGIAWARLSAGLLQGIILSMLYEASARKIWPATDGVIFAPLIAVMGFVPTIIISGLGNLRPRTLLAWTGLAIVLCAGLAAYDIARDPVVLMTFAAQTNLPRIVPSATASLSLAAILFIAHTMIVSADTDRRLIASYPAHFAISWKHGVQAVLAVCFVSVLWGLLFLGAELFRLIRIEFFATLIRKQTFYIPVTALAFACAIHVTDVRANIVQGTRTLLLILLSWLLPVMALIAAAFVVTLAFTGLEPLWATRRAGSIMLIAAAALVFLINAAHQDGRIEERVAGVLRHAKVLAAVAIVPLVGLAGYALYLRLAQYGWTPARISALACVVVAACYAIGYVIAAVRGGAAMHALENTNYITALVIVGATLALRSPLADPARISVADQVHRLEAGRVSVDHFDFSFLRFRAGRFGTEALERLAGNAQGPQAAAIAERATQTLRTKNPSQLLARAATPVTPDMLAHNITVVQPSGAALPERFLQQDWKTMRFPYLLPLCLKSDAKCDAVLTDLDGDGQSEIILLNVPNGNGVVFKAGPDNRWDMVGTLTNTFCPGVRDALRAGRFEAEADSPAFKDLLVEGQRLRVAPVNSGCIPARHAGPSPAIAPSPK